MPTVELEISISQSIRSTLGFLFIFWTRKAPFSEIYKKIGDFCFPKYKNSFIWGVRFLEHKKFSRVDFVERSISGNIRNFFGSGFFYFVLLGVGSAGLRFYKYKTRFLLRKYQSFFNVRARKFHFLKYKDILGVFFGLGLRKCAR